MAMSKLHLLLVQYFQLVLVSNFIFYGAVHVLSDDSLSRLEACLTVLFEIEGQAVVVHLALVAELQKVRHSVFLLFWPQVMRWSLFLVITAITVVSSLLLKEVALFFVHLSSNFLFSWTFRYSLSNNYIIQ